MPSLPALAACAAAAALALAVLPPASADAAPACSCNGYLGADAPPPHANVALDVSAVALALFEGSNGVQHKLAMVAAAMFDAHAARTPALDPLSGFCAQLMPMPAMGSMPGMTSMEPMEPMDAMERMDYMAPAEHADPMGGHNSMDPAEPSPDGTADCDESPDSPASPPSGAESDEDRDFIAYAAYFVLKTVLADEPDKIVLLHHEMAARGLDKHAVDTHIASLVAKAVLKKYMLTMPPPPYTARNPPSPTFDAACAALQHADGWQAQCVQPAPGEKCMPQKVPFTAFLNAPLMSYDGERRVDDLTADVPPPPAYNASLGDLPHEMGASDFADQHLKTLATSASLDDDGKWSAEFFSANAAIRAGTLTVNEARARKLSLTESLTLLLTVTGAMRDALAATVAIKLKYDSIRPVTVIQCAYAGRELTAWHSPYNGVKTFVNGENGELWRPYLQTPGFPGYISGHSAVGTAGVTAMSLYFDDDKPMASNCAMQREGMSSIEPRIEKGAFGYVANLTDVPNSGPNTVGYSPSKNVTVCWNSFSSYAEQLSFSRELGGIHIPIDNEEGVNVGKAVAKKMYDFVMSKVL